MSQRLRNQPESQLFTEEGDLAGKCGMGVEVAACSGGVGGHFEGHERGLWRRVRNEGYS